MSLLIELICSMLKIGVIGFGGGTSLIPVIERICVRDKKFVNKEELDEDVIVASITPGALPVEVACGIGKRCNRRIGMLFSTIAIASPGVVLCVLLLSLLSYLPEVFLEKITWFSFGINIFIVYLLLEFIYSNLKKSKADGRFFRDMALCVVVALLTGGSKIAAFLHIPLQRKMDLSIIRVLFLTFFYLLYAKTKRTKKRNYLAICVGMLYVFFQLFHIQNISQYCIYLIEIVMVALSVYGVYGDIKASESKCRFDWKNFIKDEIVWLLFLFLCCLPAMITCSQTLAFIGKGIVSSFLSYGGGDAYLSIADGMFVESGLITEEMFYGELVSVANVLPGSILCKVLTGVGFFIGKGIENSYLDAIAMSLVGFSVSIFGSATAFMSVHYIFSCYESLKSFQLLKIWSRPIIAGLLIPVAISLMSKSVAIPSSYGCLEVYSHLFMLGLLFISWLLMQRKNIPFLVKIMTVAFVGRLIFAFL